MAKNFLIIGSNSISASYLIKLLLIKKYNVAAVSRSYQYKDVFLPYKWSKANLNSFSFFKIDINKNIPKLLYLIKKTRPSYIVNFAAQGMVAESWLRPEDWYNTNLLSQVRFHNEIRKLKFIKKYVHVTTPEVYGTTKNRIKENFSFSPSTPYAVSRASCDLHLKSFYNSYNFPVIFTRSANVYGPGQQLYRIIPRSIIYLKIGKKLKLHGGGKSLRSFIHLDDVATATLKICLKGKIGETYHISSNTKISIKDLVKKICHINNSNFNDFVYETDDRLGKDNVYLLNSNKLRTELGWKDQLTLDNGIKQTTKWVEKNFKILKKCSLNYKHKK